MSTREELLDVIQHFPIIDHHCHPLLTEDAALSNEYSLLSLTSEAHGPALHDAVYTLAYKRASKQLAEQLNCPDTEQGILSARSRLPLLEYSKESCRGIQTLLLDDGLDDKSATNSLNWHSKIVPTAVKRIVRIESVAQSILKAHIPIWARQRGVVEGKLGQSTDDERDLRQEFFKLFDREIVRCLRDPGVAGFKSVICYRTGLDILCSATSVEPELYLCNLSTADLTVRIANKGFNDSIMIRLAELLEAAGPKKKPIQFHTGLGDNDLRLTTASPAHLQAFCEKFASIPMVLLHSGYPYHRDGAYLAAVYENVHLDIGEIFPMISSDGQASVLRECLEICPWSKMMWSTDGHWFPETYSVACGQIRHCLDEVVLVDLCERKGEISFADGIKIVKGILFDNANKLYHLNLKPTAFANDAYPHLSNSTPKSTHDRPPTDLLERFLSSHPKVNYLRLYWADYTNTVRCRVVSKSHMLKLARRGDYIDIVRGCWLFLQNDHPVAGFTPSGCWTMVPDFSSIRIGTYTSKGKDGDEAVIPVAMKDLDAANNLVDGPMCPRTNLVNALATAKKEFNLEIFCGYEHEFTIFQDNERSLAITPEHSWGSSRTLTSDALPILKDITSRLEQAGISVEQFHPESGTGQFELITTYMPALEAVDALIFTRECIQATVSHFNPAYRATFAPKVFPNVAGSGGHMHFSLSQPLLQDKFVAGILKHLKEIVAFTYASAMSYERLQEGCWAGGTYVAWGQQNRETPLRRIDKDKAHWEFRSLDALANPYLALSAIVNAGLDGLRSEDTLEKYPMCLDDPSSLSEDQRSKFNMTPLPRSLPDALKGLKEGHKFQEIMGKEVCTNHINIREGEHKLLQAMEPRERRKWIINRY